MRWRWTLRVVLVVVGVGMIGGSALWTLWYWGPRAVELESCSLVNDQTLSVGWSSGAGVAGIWSEVHYEDDVLVVDVREKRSPGAHPAIGVGRAVNVSVDWMRIRASRGKPVVVQDGKGNRLTCTEQWQVVKVTPIPPPTS